MSSSTDMAPKSLPPDISDTERAPSPFLSKLLKVARNSSERMCFFMSIVAARNSVYERSSLFSGPGVGMSTPNASLSSLKLITPSPLLSVIMKNRRGVSISESCTMLAMTCKKACWSLLSFRNFMTFTRVSFHRRTSSALGTTRTNQSLTRACSAEHRCSGFLISSSLMKFIAGWETSIHSIVSNFTEWFAILLLITSRLVPSKGF
mmetsp:Transcript_10068/g.17769  ORF Transcript_10068/g.17769 Transcript_10068/m.17769 type:complete len:206 (+) Transcript_10068:479-1096(+)